MTMAAANYLNICAIKGLAMFFAVFAENVALFAKKRSFFTLDNKLCENSLSCLDNQGGGGGYQAGRLRIDTSSCVMNY